jgi:hypothetical protein
MSDKFNIQCMQNSEKSLQIKQDIENILAYSELKFIRSPLQTIFAC